MKITSITVQQKNKNRVNVSVDGVYRFSLDIHQVAELGIRKDRDYTEQELVELEQESQYGKLYARTLEYCLLRPHSAKEVRDYLYKKTFTTKVRNKKTGELREKDGVSKELTARVYERLVEKGYIDDEKFVRFWLEYRHQKKGASKRKLQSELRQKGVELALIERFLTETVRDDEQEIRKVIEKKQARYDDPRKLMQYLMRQGFSYELIQRALSSTELG